MDDTPNGPLDGLNEQLDASITRALARVMQLALSERHDTPPEELIRGVLLGVQRDTLLVSTLLANVMTPDPEPTSNRTSRWASDGESVSFT